VLWQLLELMDENPLSRDQDLEFLATHPVHKTRYEKLYDQLNTALRLRFDCGCAKLDPSSDPIVKLQDYRKFLASES